MGLFLFGRPSGLCRGTRCYRRLTSYLRNPTDIPHQAALLGPMPPFLSLTQKTNLGMESKDNNLQQAFINQSLFRDETLLLFVSM